MKSLYSFLLFIWSFLTFAACEVGHHKALDVDTYYRSISTSASGLELKYQLNLLIRNHVRYSYSCVWEILKDIDKSEALPDHIRTIYTQRDIPFTLKDDGNNNPESWNREHIWPKSHGFPEKKQFAYTDLHHIRAADRSVNSDRSDNDFDDGGEPDSECTQCFEGNGTWQPPNEMKGDIARMLFYMDVRYDGNDGSGTPDLQLVDKVSTLRTNKTHGYGQLGKLCTLYQWHLDDPVSIEESERNTRVFHWQSNLNPFIDHPVFVHKIWGQQCHYASNK